MAKKKRLEAEDGLEGTVEGLARDHFEREKAEYEKRTGKKVHFQPAEPVTRTPIIKAIGPETPEEASEGEGEV